MASDEEPDEETQQVLVGVSFPDVFRAREFLTAATRLAALDQLNVADAVLIVKSDGGDTRVTETIDPQARNTALSGALWTGLLGLVLGGPIGWVAGAALGAGTGAVAAKVIDLGISDDWVKWFREAVQPGNAVVALLLGDSDADALVAEAERFPGAQLMYANLEPGVLAELGEHWGAPLHAEGAADERAAEDSDRQ